MSAAIEQAIAHDIRREYPDSIITGYTWIAVVQQPSDMDECTYYPHGALAGMDRHSIIGLVRQLTLYVEGDDQ